MSDDREPVGTPPVRPQIRGEMVFLRPPERSDIPRFVRWLNDLDVSRHLLLRAPLSVQRAS